MFYLSLNETIRINLLLFLRMLKTIPKIFCCFSELRLILQESLLQKNQTSEFVITNQFVLIFVELRYIPTWNTSLEIRGVQLIYIGTPIEYVLISSLWQWRVHLFGGSHSSIRNSSKNLNKFGEKTGLKWHRVLQPRFHESQWNEIRSPTKERPQEGGKDHLPRRCIKYSVPKYSTYITKDTRQHK